MADSVAGEYGSLLAAASFSARAHRHQLRKDRETPYAAHPFRACLIVRHVFGVDDPEVLATALLHDTIEDTPTDRDDLIEHFGQNVAAWVSALSKDMRLPEQEREAAYMETLSASPAPVKICKLADMFDNLLDWASLSEQQRKRTIARSHQYLEALDKSLGDTVRPAFKLVQQLLAEVASTSK